MSHTPVRLQRWNGVGSRDIIETADGSDAEFTDRKHLIPCPGSGGSMSYTETLCRMNWTGTEEWEANADRVVATWNACAGIPTEALEADVVRRMQEAMAALVDRFEVFTGPDRHGWGNQENAYYDLAKHAQKEWAAMQAILKELDQ